MKNFFRKKLIYLLVVADSHKAKIFEKTGKKKCNLNLVCELEADLDSNHEKLGRSFNRIGPLRHAIEPNTDRRQVEKHKFAEKIMHTLEELEKEKRYDGLVLLASYKILEQIGKTINHQLKQKISHKLAKNLSNLTDGELKEYLDKNL